MKLCLFLGADLRQQVEHQRIVCANNLDGFHGNGNRSGADLDIEQAQGVQFDQMFPAAQCSQKRSQRAVLAVVARTGIGKSRGDEEFALDRVETGVEARDAPGARRPGAACGCGRRPTKRAWPRALIPRSRAWS